MTSVDAESVAGPPHGKSHVMQMMTSELHLYPSQQLQPTAVSLPVSVEHLTYEDDDFVDAGDDDDVGDGTVADNGGPPVMSVNPEVSYSVSAVTSSQCQPAPSVIDCDASTSTDIFHSMMV